MDDVMRNHTDFTGDELQVIKDALLMAKAREETEYFETEKRILDSLPAAPDENLSAVVG